MNDIDHARPDRARLPGPDRDGLLLLDPQGRVVYANRVFEEMIGRGGDELRGRTCDEIFDEETCRVLDPRRRPPAGDPDRTECDVSVAGAGGAARSYRLSASALRGPGGRLIGVLESFRGADPPPATALDVEDADRILLREREKMEDLLEALADGLFAVDRERRILSFSDGMERLTGLRAAETVGRTCMDVLRGTRCDTDCPLAWSLGHGRAVAHCAEVIRAADGRALPIVLTTTLQHDARGEIRGLTGVVRDRSEMERLHVALRERRSRRDVIGRSPAMLEVIRLVDAVADTDAAVLIDGEEGTGKALVARAIHDRSARGDGPFVRLGCAPLGDDLRERELFGHVRGAFAGAVRDRPGRVEAAEGGTLFLEAVDRATPALQLRLLRLLTEGTFERVGETRSRAADVRCIAATRRDLKSLVGEGRFRADLCDHLGAVTVRLPPLRERREDIPLLAQHFIDRYRSRYFAGRERDFEGISNGALALLMSHDWPGNVRELERAIEYAMLATTALRIEPASLPEPLRRLRGAGPFPGGREAPPAGSDRTQPAAAPEAILLQALERNRWNATRTARELGVSRTTLWRRMKRLDLLKSTPPSS